MAVQTHNCANVLRGGLRLCTIIAALVLSGFALPAHAQAPTVEIDEMGPPVPDAELGQIRGKFIKPDSISYFGISMITSWQDESGVTTVARLLFNVDFLKNGGRGGPVPSLMIGWVREGDPSMDVTQSHEGYTQVLAAQSVSPVGGLGETSGAAQANIIAGADNTALNGMRIALVPHSELQQFGIDGLVPINATSVQSFGDGDQLEFRLGANELGLFLTGNHGSDSSLQSVGGEFGNLLQQTVLNSNGNAVFNNAAVIIGTDLNGTGFDAIRATQALSSMKGHGF